MSNVINFARKPRDDTDERWASGAARCHSPNCGHEWHAVAPEGTTTLDCPKCHDSQGHWRGEFQLPEGTLVRTCNCGEQLFYITPEGHLCRACGTYQRY